MRISTPSSPSSSRAGWGAEARSRLATNRISTGLRQTPNRRMASDIDICNSTIVKAMDIVPPGDFITEGYDAQNVTQAKTQLVIFSTPRSGSTFLCDLLYRHSICLPHEYFQPSQYLPILANRWRCIDDGRIDKAAYVEHLLRRRTSRSGCFGLNLHGDHLSVYTKFEHLFPELDTTYIHLIRKDLLAQSVSYEIATQTQQWTSAWPERTVANYSFRNIKCKMETLQQQNALIHAFVTSRELQCVTVFYEDLVADPARVLSSVIPGFLPGSADSEPSVQRQYKSRNKDWTTRFAHEFIAHSAGREPSTTPRKRVTSLARVSRWYRRLWRLATWQVSDEEAHDQD